MKVTQKNKNAKFAFLVGVYLITLPIFVAYGAIVLSSACTIAFDGIQSPFAFVVPESVVYFAELRVFPLVVLLLLFTHGQMHRYDRVAFWVMIALALFRYIPYLFEMHGLLVLSFGLFLFSVISFFILNTRNLVFRVKDFTAQKMIEKSL